MLLCFYLKNPHHEEEQAHAETGRKVSSVQEPTSINMARTTLAAGLMSIYLASGVYPELAAEQNSRQVHKREKCYEVRP